MSWWNPWAGRAQAEEDARIERDRADELESSLGEVFAMLKKKEEEEQAIKDEETKLARLIAEEHERKNAAKTLATERGETYITVTQIDVTQGVANGNFEFDWNDHFIKELHKGGYIGVSDEQAVEQWFRDICKYVLAEAYEQADADLGEPAVEDLGDGLKSYS